ncbi:hypothetical protein A3Q56_04511 [Intoshia linei]|uniref:Uncharacterized protein n=1 Tax=Intoshia linei TaxID=1819745 RepID=A0A177B2W2_9BILA|nr:hypothetical protein A3Q56_04511 [Intoshia linei]
MSENQVNDEDNNETNVFPASETQDNVEITPAASQSTKIENPSETNLTNGTNVNSDKEDSDNKSDNLGSENETVNPHITDEVSKVVENEKFDISAPDTESLQVLTVRAYLDKTLVPILLQAMTAVAKERTGTTFCEDIEKRNMGI